MERSGKEKGVGGETKGRKKKRKWERKGARGRNDIFPVHPHPIPSPIITNM